MSVPLLGKRKETDPCRSQFDDLCRRPSPFAATEEKEEEEEEPCEVCKVAGHWPVHCPWKFDLPFGPLPEIPISYWVQCQRCGNGEFNESYYCTECGCGRKNVLLRRCWMKRRQRDNTD